MATMPPQYYQRFDTAKEYEEHLFIAGRGLQSAELNEIQKHSANRLRGIADALFKDGDIVRDAACIVDGETGAVECFSGAIYIRGAVRGVAPASFTIPTTGTHSIGVRLIDTVVTALDDPDLLDPATGTRNYNEPGAERLRVHAQWGWSGDSSSGQFFPVYSVTDGFLAAKDPPPNLDPIVQSLARYDRDSAGGTYVVSGLALKAMPDDGPLQVYSLQEGKARVYGYGIEINSSRRLTRAATPDLRAITNEPHLSAGATAQRINFDNTPGTNITEVAITAEKTVNLVHGVFTGAQDTLPDTSVLSLIEVKQGATTYVATTDYLLTAGKVDWSPGGAEPSPGSTYSVTYRYITTVTPTAVDDDGFTVTGAVAGTLVLVSYSQKLPRWDRLCLSQLGEPVWLTGIASAEAAQRPTVPADLLAIASVYQTWTADRLIYNDGVRVVPMPQLAAVEGRLDLLAQLIAQQRLESNIHTRESGTKKGLFTDPFIDDSQRDAGTSQTAAVVRGELVLPITATVHQVSADIAAPAVCAFTPVTSLQQILRTGEMKINPYQAFGLVPARVTLTPPVDRWTQTETIWSGPQTERFSIGNNAPVAAFGGSPTLGTVSTNVQNVLLNTSRSNIETLRPISISYRVEGFGPNEQLAMLLFDNVPITQPGGLAANASGVLTGTFTIPTGIPAGNKLIAVVGRGGAYGEATFSGQGTLERQTWQQRTTVTTTWQSPPPPVSAPVLGPTQAVFGPTSNGTMNPGAITDDGLLALLRITGNGGDGAGVNSTDPLAQTFILRDNTQITAVDLWFVSASTTPTRIQIRETSTGLPNSQIVAESTVLPSAIVVGGNSTRINFAAPVLLLGGVEYALVVLCDDPVGGLAVAELGKFDSVAQQWITSQPYTVGVLLSSSNASTWTPHQDRDMAFRLLRANYTSTSRNINLGTAAVTAATDLILMSFAERPASATGVDYVLTLPDASTLTVTDGQAIQLPAAITGNIGVTARLTGTAEFSPVLTPGTQIVAGQVSLTADYVSRAVPAGSSSTIKVIYEAVVPSGATVAVQYKGIDIPDTWSSNIAVASTRPVDDGFVEFIHTVTGVNETAAQIKLILNGTAAARPRIRDLRVIVT